MAAKEADDDSECAICFDPVAAEDRLPLPCRCRLTYCPRCWDRALAAAFNDCGRARCPSCRRPVRVDFDPEAGNGLGRLVFSAGGVDGGDGGGEEGAARARAEVVNRLAEQAAPLMTRLLRRYGAEHPRLRATARQPAAALAARPVGELRRLLWSLGGDGLSQGARVRLQGLQGRADLNGSEGHVRAAPRRGSEGQLAENGLHPA